MLVVAGVVLLVLAAVPSRVFLVFVLLAMWSTRWGLPVGQLTLRSEHLIAGAAALRILFSLNLRIRVPVSAVVALGALATWITLALMTAVFESPNTAGSLNVIAWTAGGIVTAVWLALHPSLIRTALVTGARVALGFMALGIFCWALASAGIVATLVQVDPAYGGFSAYGLSHEANLFAGLACLWGILAAFNPRQALSRGLQAVVVFASPVAIVASHTRAALIALALALVLLIISSLGVTRLIQAGLGVAISLALFPHFVAEDEGLAKFTNLFDLSGGTGGLRIEISKLAVGEWKAQDGLPKWFGLGFNSFGQRHLDPTRPGEGAEAYVGTLPVQLLYDGGIVALLLIGIAVCATVVPVLSRGNRGAVTVTALAGAYLALSLATSSLWLLQTWVFVGLAWAVIRDAAVPRDESAHTPPLGATA